MLPKIAIVKESVEKMDHANVTGGFSWMIVQVSLKNEVLQPCVRPKLIFDFFFQFSNLILGYRRKLRITFKKII